MIFKPIDSLRYATQPRTDFYGLHVAVHVAIRDAVHAATRADVRAATRELGREQAQMTPDAMDAVPTARYVGEVSVYAALAWAMYVVSHPGGDLADVDG